MLEEQKSQLNEDLTEIRHEKAEVEEQMKMLASVFSLPFYCAFVFQCQIEVQPFRVVVFSIG